MATAVPDVSSLLDVASSSTAAPVEEPRVETTEVSTETETPESGEGTSKETPEITDKPVDGRTNPDAIRKALKAFRDSSPENAKVAKELNNGYGRYLAYQTVFPKVEDAKSAKAILDAVGGNDGIASLQSMIKSVNETDSLLYAGDPRVIDNLIEDFKREGKPEALGKLASPFLDKLRSTDEKAYFKAIKPHFFQGLVDVNLPGVLSGLVEALNGATPNVDAAKTLVGEMTKWFDGLRNSVETTDKSKLDPERQAFEQERTEFQTAKQKEFQAGVNKEWNTENNRILGRELAPYLKMPFAKNWTQETKVDLAQGIVGSLLRELTADKTYQSQMDAFWSEKTPDKAKILNYHKSKVEMIGKRIVEQVLNNRYPGFRKSAVTMPPKTVVAGKPNGAARTATTPSANRPIYTPTKLPLDQMDMSKDPNRMLLATGRAYDKKTGKLMSWNVKDKAQA